MYGWKIYAIITIFTLQSLRMKHNLLKLILLLAIAYPITSCHSHKKAAKQPDQKVLRPMPRQRNY